MFRLKSVEAGLIIIFVRLFVPSNFRNDATTDLDGTVAVTNKTEIKNTGELKIFFLFLSFRSLKSDTKTITTFLKMNKRRANSTYYI